ncbi:MAG: thioredoxin fold domain-containing protein [Taibaiella sp.]|nr:thioredoxin fold domain-containing protein [Taibaiella sp.]
MRNLVFILFILCACSFGAQGQDRKARRIKDSLPYMKYPELPAFNIRLQDSVNVFNTFNIPKGRPALLVLFDPDCKHCHDVTVELMRGIDSLSNIDMYWLTFNASMTKTREFYKEFKMEQYPNIKVLGRDYEMFFIDYYGVNSFPDFALYDENKKIIHLFEGRVTVNDLHEYTHKK